MIDSAEFSLGRKPKRNLFTHVVEQIGTRIVRGDLKPDAPFPNESDLGREFGASRSVIREAVKSLAARGLIESRTRMGIRVLPAIHWNLLDTEVLRWRFSAMQPAQFFAELFEIRLMIEPQASGLAASRGTAKQIAEIEHAFAEMCEATHVPTGIEADLRFHRGILAASNNALLLQMGNLIGVGLAMSHQMSNDSFAVFLPMHERVLDAICKHDTAAAESAMRTLLTETLRFSGNRFANPATDRTASTHDKQAVLP